MKLIYIANIRLPTEKAHGIQIMKMCEAFAKVRGLMRKDTRTHADTCTVNLIVPARKNPQFTSVDPFEYYCVERNFVIRRLPVVDPVWLMRAAPQGVYIKAQAVLYIASLLVYWFIGLLKTLYQAQDDVVVYTRDEYLLPTLLRMARRVVWEAHTLPSRALLYVNYWKRCERIVAITKGLKEDLVKLAVPDEKILVAPDGVDLQKFQIPNSKFQIREKLGLPHDKFIVMYIGHLYEWKGAQTLADAALKLPEDVLTVLVGGTVHDLQKFKEKNMTNDRIRLVGFVPLAIIPAYLTSADVLILPNSSASTVSERYTSPLKLFEYMASGVPIVASNLPSLHEILNEHNATFFTADDHASLNTAIVHVKEHHTEAFQKAERAKEQAFFYLWENRAQRIISFISSASYEPMRSRE